MLRLKIVFGLVLVVAVGTRLAAGEAKKDSTADKAAAAAAFDRLKKLAGDWEFVNPKDAADKGKTAIRYQVTAGGSALVETIFPGSDMEMVSVYHRDGDDLVMTHYCCCGNQPRVRACSGGDKDEIAFEFAGGTNLNASKDMHMHSFRVRILDADHVHTDCQLFSGGKPCESHSFDLVRKK
jgi:hypothetical protein